MSVTRTLGNVRNFSRRLFDFLTLILNETRSTNEIVRLTSGEVPLQLQRIGEIVTINNLISKRLSSGSSALNDFCDEASQLLLQQQNQIETLLSANKLLIERTYATGQLLDRKALELDRSLVQLKDTTTHLATTVARTNLVLESQDKRLFAVEEIMKAQETVLPSWHATPEAAAEIRDVLRLVTPRSAVGSEKRRFGRDFDGGYIMLDDFKGASSALSLGINDDVSWDLDMARRDIKILQFDHTIDAAPASHDQFRFYSLRIADEPGDGAVTLQQAVEMAETGSPLILKMDIEGDEWSVLDSTPTEILARCSQIAIEFHHMERLMDSALLSQARRVFEKLTQSFFLCHVHGNNCGNLVNIHNIVLPETLEMTFANSALYRSETSSELFPQKLDMPNQPGRADFFLGTFNF